MVRAQSKVLTQISGTDIHRYFGKAVLVLRTQISRVNFEYAVLTYHI